MTRSRLLVTLLLPLVVASLACQAVMRAFEPAPVPQVQSQAHSFPGPASATPLPPTLTPTFTPSPSPSPLPPSATPTATETAIPTPSELQLQVFEHLWRAVDEDYVYPDFNGLDWQAVHKEYRQRILAGMTDPDFYDAMYEMILSLGDDHSVFLSPQEAREEDTEFAGKNNYVGIGVLSILIRERQRVSILVVFSGSPADEAGLKPHDNILTVDGIPIVDDNGDRRDLLRGPEGTTVEITVQTPGEAPRQLSLTRRQVSGAVPVPYEVLTGPQGRRIGYVLLSTFADDTVDDQLQEALRVMSADAPLDGLILDNRQNTGGTDEVAKNALSYFTSGNLGEFTDRRNHTRGFGVIGADIAGSLRLPLVVLIGPNTISFGEIFSGVLKDSGRAYLIGELTNGNVELLSGYNFEDGSRAWIARETFRPRHNSSENWEETGIVPDQSVPSNWDEVTLNTDPAVKAAIEYLEGVR